MDTRLIHIQRVPRNIIPLNSMSFECFEKETSNEGGCSSSTSIKSTSRVRLRQICFDKKQEARRNLPQRFRTVKATTFPLPTTPCFLLHPPSVATPNVRDLSVRLDQECNEFPSSLFFFFFFLPRRIV